MDATIKKMKEDIEDGILTKESILRNFELFINEQKDSIKFINNITKKFRNAIKHAKKYNDEKIDMLIFATECFLNRLASSKSEEKKILKKLIKLKKNYLKKIEGNKII